MEHVKWLGHDGFMITGEKTVVIDPYKVKNVSEKANVILITHEHFDHCSVEDIMKFADETTEILIPPDCQSKLPEFPGKVTLVEPDKDYNAEGLKVTTVRAYNKDKEFHPKENDWVGYIFEVNGKRYYHAGDTDYIDEMHHIKNIDVAFLPVSGTYVMTPEEAAQAATIISPVIAVPMHYGTLVGNESDAEKFRKAYNGQVEILSIEE